MLRIDAAYADAALAQAIDALPTLPDAEVPGAVALALRLAGDTPGAAEPAVRAARRAVGARGAAATLGMLQTLAFAVTQHPAAAAAYVAAVAADAAAAAIRRRRRKRCRRRSRRLWRRRRVVWSTCSHKRRRGRLGRRWRHP